MTKHKNYYSCIQDSIHISETEIAKVVPDYHYSWLEEDTEKLKGILYDLGMDTGKPFELQPPVQHRNRLGEVVTSARYYGTERSDPEYLRSGFASQAALDKAKNCRLLDDLYKERGLTIDAQLALESRDKYVVETEDDFE
jgi:hypothetical protein